MTYKALILGLLIAATIHSSAQAQALDVQKNAASNPSDISITTTAPVNLGFNTDVPESPNAANTGKFSGATYTALTNVPEPRSVLLALIVGAVFVLLRRKGQTA